MDAAAGDLRIAYQECPLCGGSALAQEWTADCTGHPLYCEPLPRELRWLRCEACGHVFTDSYFNDAGLAALFRGVPAGQTPGEDAEGTRLLSARMIERVGALRTALGAPPRDLAERPGRWIDVGFGNGALLATAAEHGYEVVGLDLREGHVALLREFGYEAHCQDLHAYQPEAPADVLSLCDVLEHMPFPRQALLRAREVLAERGVLLLSMPNLDSFLWRQLNERGENPYWAELEHLHNFGRARLFALLRECGFAPAGYAVSERYLAGMEVLALRG